MVIFHSYVKLPEGNPGDGGVPCLESEFIQCQRSPSHHHRSIGGNSVYHPQMVGLWHWGAHGIGLHT